MLNFSQNLVILLIIFLIVIDSPVVSLNLFSPVDTSISGCLPMLCMLLALALILVYLVVKYCSLSKAKLFLNSYLEYTSSFCNPLQSLHAGVIHAFVFVCTLTLLKLLFYFLYPYLFLFVLCCINLFSFIYKSLFQSIMRLKPAIIKAAPIEGDKEDFSDKESSHPGTSNISMNQKGSFHPALPVSSIFHELTEEHIAFIQSYFGDRLSSKSPYVSQNPLTTI